MPRPISRCRQCSGPKFKGSVHLLSGKAAAAAVRRLSGGNSDRSLRRRGAALMSRERIGLTWAESVRQMTPPPPDDVNSSDKSVLSVSFCFPHPVSPRLAAEYRVPAAIDSLSRAINQQIPLTLDRPPSNSTSSDSISLSLSLCFFVRLSQFVSLYLYLCGLFGSTVTNIYSSISAAAPPRFQPIRHTSPSTICSSTFNTAETRFKDRARLGIRFTRRQSNHPSSSRSFYFDAIAVVTTSCRRAGGRHDMPPPLSLCWRRST